MIAARAPLAGAADSGCTTNWLQCGVDSVKDGIGNAVQGVQDTANGIGGVANFWSDPAENSYKALRDAANGLAGDVLPALTHATLPDLTADWFVNAYRVSFGLAVFVFVVLLIPQIVNTARGRQSGAELVETLTLYGPAFLIGAMFGPAVGAFLVRFFGALSDALITSMLSTTSSTIAGEFTKMIGTGDGAGIVGGAVVGVILMFLMILALLLALLVLIVQLITLYFSGVLFPLGWVWIVDRSKRQFGAKIPFVWLGILASHPLLFFLLGVTFSFVGANVTVLAGQPSLQKTVSLVSSMLALFIAGLSPLLLFKFAPVLPMGGAAATGGPNIGAASPQDADRRASAPQPGTAALGSPSPVSASGSAPSGPALAAGEAGGAGSSIGEAASIGGKAAAAGGGASAGAAGAAEGGVVAAGAGASATGVGAVVGVPLMVGAAAKAGMDKAHTAAEGAAEMAGAPMEDHDAQYGKDTPA